LHTALRGVAQVRCIEHQRRRNQKCNQPPGSPIAPATRRGASARRSRSRRPAAAIPPRPPSQMAAKSA